MPKRISYTMSRFPKLTETFILYEILEFERLGVAVEVFPLVREKNTVIHAEAHDCRSTRTLFASCVAGYPAFTGILVDTPPARYVKLWWQATWGHRQSLKFMSRAIAVVPQAAHFARQMQSLNIEHLHAHYATHPAFAAYVINMLADIPYSITAHAHDLYVDRTFLQPKLEAARDIITISEFNYNLIKAEYGQAIADKTHVIHCGIDSDIFLPRSELPADAPFTIICVASLQDYKGQQYLIGACAILKQKGLAFRCWLVGEGEDRPQLEAQIARHELQEHVILWGGNRATKFRKCFRKHPSWRCPASSQKAAKWKASRWP